MTVELGATISSILGGVKEWNTHKVRSKEKINERIEAINKVYTAAIATKAYSYDAQVLDSGSRDEEKELSKAWREAGMAISEYDHSLYIISNVKSLGWADPREWHKPKNSSVIMELDTIIEQCEWLLTQDK